jgi:carboxylesterase
MWFVLLLLAVSAITAAVLMSRRRAFGLRDDTMRRLPVGADGIIPGAEAFELTHPEGGAPAVLLLHGGGDTPQALRYLAAYLYEHGYDVRAPLLPGHGRTVREFSRVSADEWLQAARSAYRELAPLHDWVGIAGLSMGGAIAVQVAAETPTLPALALLAPYFAMPAYIAVAARLAPIWAPIAPFVRAIDPAAAPSIHDRAEADRSLGYGVFTPTALRALHRTVMRAIEVLPNVNAPTLMIQSREDNRVSPPAAQRAFDRLGTRDKELVWLTGAGHVITVDYGREQIFQRVVDFFARHRRGAAMPLTKLREH